MNLDLNSYASKKSYVHALLNVSLISANASQLSTVLKLGSSFDFYTLLVVLITSSIIIQVSEKKRVFKKCLNYFFFKIRLLSVEFVCT